MKSKKLFGIINTLNTGLWIIFFVFLIRRNNIGDDFFIFAILASIAFLFSFFCYRLTKIFRAVIPLTDGSRLIGPIIVVLFSLLIIFSDWNSIVMIKNWVLYGLGNVVFINVVFLALSICSTYLCIAYWIIRKEIQTQLTGLITDLGKEENS